MLQTQVIDAVRSGKDSIGDLLLRVSLIKRTSSYDVASGANNATSQTHPLEGFIDAFDMYTDNRDLVLITDIKFTVFADFVNGVEPSESDELVVNGKTYKILKVNLVYVGPTPAIFNLYLKG